MREEKWVVSAKRADFQKIGQEYGIDPVIARLIRNREVQGSEQIDQYLNGKVEDLPSPWLFKDMEKAVNLIEAKIRQRKLIRIIGDYDIDGVVSTYILLRGLDRLKAKVDTYIPDRVADGYGIHLPLIEKALEDGIDTILTCDNGIAAYNEIVYAKERGLTVIVTDHHEVPYLEAGGEKEYLIPDADAVVNPHLPGDPYPFKGLCGAAVVYKVVEALYNVMGQDADDVDFLMENVAIATVGDVMDLVDENRIFVKQGLEMLKRTQNEGLKALMECTQVPIERLSAYHIGFVIGPCINASGRLDTAKRALELLEVKNRREAVMMAEDLKALNDSRKEMTEKGVEQAVEQIETTDLKEDRVLVVYLQDCHESIAGIIAGRLKEKYYKPVFVLTQGEHGVKGSGRSIESYHMFEEMCKCRALFTKFGGHKLAAGLSLEEENVERFRRTINELCELTSQDLMPKVSIDMQLPLAYVTEELIEELELLEPFGKGNTKPLFAEKNLKVQNLRVIGKNQNVLKFQVLDRNGRKMEAIYFGEVQECMEYLQGKEEVALTFYPSVNEYRGNKSIQITVVNYQ